MGHNLLDKKSDRPMSRKRKRITSEEQIFVPKRKML
jgi:heme O synthase-like polyprenyltransferase